MSRLLYLKRPCAVVAVVLSRIRGYLERHVRKEEYQDEDRSLTFFDEWIERDAPNCTVHTTS